eukprot:PLAT1562.1.p1 GENE.PLAT1562.1~~PLAT1562.1.p1  ORF type:complete len:228 (+),score=85.13 PLAT1562.1:29-685(+)
MTSSRLSAALLLVCLACALALEAEVAFDYGPKFKVGEWKPPAPPAKETPHFGGESIPAPAHMAHAALDGSAKPTGDALLDDGTAALLQVMSDSETAQKIPHNWMGVGHFHGRGFAVATGQEQCDLCERMIAAAGDSPLGLVDPVSGRVDAPVDICDDVDPEFRVMCHGYRPYLTKCPSFTHDICHEDLGGAERLRAPCPSHLKCYYCLRINPLYCIDE